ncbi:CcdC protein domain-containing protein [Paenibacillus amylolyticus]|uniref:CcdC protein domain-containing protein n=1 Tax=Paenibacillus amylolyticus TaxID=1451 RepID=UPI003D27DA04
MNLFTYKKFKYPRYLGYTKNRRGAYYECIIFNNLDTNCPANFEGFIQGSKKPLHESGRKLLIPILYISTSLFELFDPALVITTGRIISSVAIGAILSIPSILVTQFERKSDGGMYYKRYVSLYVFIVVIFGIRFFDFMFITDIDPKTLGFLNNVIALFILEIITISCPWLGRRTCIDKTKKAAI